MFSRGKKDKAIIEGRRVAREGSGAALVQSEYDSAGNLVGVGIKGHTKKPLQTYFKNPLGGGRGQHKDYMEMGAVPPHTPPASVGRPSISSGDSPPPLAALPGVDPVDDRAPPSPPSTTSGGDVAIEVAAQPQTAVEYLTPAHAALDVPVEGFVCQACSIPLKPIHLTETLTVDESIRVINRIMTTLMTDKQLTAWCELTVGEALVKRKMVHEVLVWDEELQGIIKPYIKYSHEIRQTPELAMMPIAPACQTHWWHAACLLDTVDAVRQKNAHAKQPNQWCCLAKTGCVERLPDSYWASVAKELAGPRGRLEIPTHYAYRVNQRCIELQKSPYYKFYTKYEDNSMSLCAKLSLGFGLVGALGLLGWSLNGLIPKGGNAGNSPSNATIFDINAVEQQVGSMGMTAPTVMPTGLLSIPTATLSLGVLPSAPVETLLAAAQTSAVTTAVLESLAASQLLPTTVAGFDAQSTIARLMTTIQFSQTGTPSQLQAVVTSELAGTPLAPLSKVVVAMLSTQPGAAPTSSGEYLSSLFSSASPTGGAATSQVADVTTALLKAVTSGAPVSSPLSPATTQALHAELTTAFTTLFAAPVPTSDILQTTANVVRAFTSQLNLPVSTQQAIVESSTIAASVLDATSAEAGVEYTASALADTVTIAAHQSGVAASSALAHVVSSVSTRVTQLATSQGISTIFGGQASTMAPFTSQPMTSAVGVAAPTSAPIPLTSQRQAPTSAAGVSSSLLSNPYSTLGIDAIITSAAERAVTSIAHNPAATTQVLNDMRSTIISQLMSSGVPKTTAREVAVQTTRIVVEQTTELPGMPETTVIPPMQTTQVAGVGAQTSIIDNDGPGSGGGRPP